MKSGFVFPVTLWVLHGQELLNNSFMPGTVCFHFRHCHLWPTGFGSLSQHMTTSPLAHGFPGIRWSSSQGNLCLLLLVWQAHIMSLGKLPGPSSSQTSSISCVGMAECPCLQKSPVESFWWAEGMLGNDIVQQISQQMVPLTTLKYSLDVGVNHEPKEASKNITVVKARINLHYYCYCYFYCYFYYYYNCSCV